MEATEDEKQAVGLYAVLARDFMDFIEMIGEASQETLKTLHLMLTHPNDNHDDDTKELNALGASLVEPLLKDQT